MNELQNFDRARSEELKNPVLRLFQIAEALKKHLTKKHKGKA